MAALPEVGGRIEPGGAPTVSEAFAFLSRRKWAVLGAAVPIAFASVWLAFWLPAVYESQATILVEQQTIPQDVVAQSGGASYVDEQIQVVSQRVLSTANVRNLIDKFHLYPSDSSTSGLDAIAQFRGNTAITPMVTQVSDNRGRPGNATYGFTVSYRAPKPELAQTVTGELANLYVQENVKARTERAADTTNFLQSETQRLAQEIADKEKELADFKDKYGEALPDQRTFNAQSLDRVQRDLEQVKQNVIDLRSQRDLLRNQLAATDPHATIYSSTGEPVLSAANRLAELRQQYAQLLARYGPEHPDVIRTKREIDALSSGDPESGPDIEAQIASLEAELKGLRDRGYTEEHPDVQRAEHALDALRGELQNAPQTPAKQSRPPDNPEYIQRKVQLDSVSQSLAAAVQRQRSLAAREAELEHLLAIAPKVEQDWLNLNRGYDAARAEYNDIQRRTTQAKLSQRLEQENQGDRFTLIDKASLPQQPVEPNRPAVIFLGFVLALGAGIGIAALADAMDDTVRSTRDLITTTGMKPLAVIPYIQTRRDRRNRLIRSAVVTASICAGAYLLIVFL
jgi:succinoglycan biosynthesis transport protein ExoP